MIQGKIILIIIIIAIMNVHIIQFKIKINQIIDHILIIQNLILMKMNIQMIIIKMKCHNIVISIHLKIYLNHIILKIIILAPDLILNPKLILNHKHIKMIKVDHIHKLKVLYISLINNKIFQIPIMIRYRKSFNINHHQNNFYLQFQTKVIIMTIVKLILKECPIHIILILSFNPHLIYQFLLIDRLLLMNNQCMKIRIMIKHLNMIVTIIMTILIHHILQILFKIE